MTLQPDIAAARGPVPAKAGIGLRSAHYADLLTDPHRVAWVEVHPENFMCAGGPQHRVLGKVRDHCALSFHGVGLSLGGTARPDPAHLGRLADLMRRYEPACFSEHLAWSEHGGQFLNDLLPLPYTHETLDRVVAHVDEVQGCLGRRLLIENPSLYLSFDGNDMAETDLLSELVRRTGCGLLLDINNVFVSANNLDYDPRGYLAAYPLQCVGEIHLAGYRAETDADGTEVLIDTHGSLVAGPVWDLYRHVVAQTGPLPTLIEWDQDLPSWDVLRGEAARAQAILNTHAGNAHVAA
ncbi:MNIO family bufferin maturase [Dongia rigui]|uniref:UPF0276 protein SMD31_00960 n=1 Tax=Dongia rigui TaxID=940149 RepID=A0ABU5DV43_9PROT|nr:DUF692 domain-containing protein [Dongia rigui]MDY0870466.1 DUF692 domain-containing protein [Dongia rigui]